MLQIKNIVKTYVTGDMRQDALKGVSVNFRNNEFVSILGHSGSGKTTLLNIIGGLDRYTSGDLIINGVSTKKYKDADWDIYRNKKIGFVFQSYNLIPHQTVLANVEMALTLSGVSPRERRERSVRALKRVGLGEHIHKKPNQMSGGQMQRVAIARALVNNPDILLADEPTGALDSETSIQIMELLKEIAQDKLVIMVTHNPELAEQYSTRIVRLMDGKIVSDTNPCGEADAPAEPKRQKKVSMSFLTALSLSFNNLRTKKGRTLLTSFAGSIGIIGIALILALSTGMNAYIGSIQKETMTAYPITINAQTFDTSALTGLRGQLLGGNGAAEGERNGVYADDRDIRASEAVVSGVTQNNLTAFKQYLDDPDSDIRRYLGENGVVYSYDVAFSVYTRDAEGRLIDTDSEPEETGAAHRSSMGGFASLMNEGSGAENFSEMMAGTDGRLISPVVTDNYELLYGAWPDKYDEVVLILDKNYSLPAQTLYQLGMITAETYRGLVDTIKNGGSAEEIRLDYAEACGRSYYLVPACDFYVEHENGVFSRIEDAVLGQNVLMKNAIELKVSGVVRPASGASGAELSTPMAYTAALTERIIAHTAESAVVKAQTASPEINVLNGMRFSAATDEEKIAMTLEYIGGMDVYEKASVYRMMMYYSAGSAAGEEAQSRMSAALMNDSAMAMALDKWLAGDPDSAVLLEMYGRCFGSASYQDNMTAFGSVSYDTPSAISIYADNFEDKEALADCIRRYNESANEDSRISYTDYVAMMTSSLTTIINGISYVLIAFVAISLIVSCIMIGIITHISVMERTKEIGILRALGASKGSISQVFNAETFIIGCCSGLLGIGVTLLLLLPINSIIAAATGIANLSAQLPIASSAALIVVSILITMLGGLLPAKKAAKKDPVIALRTE